MTALNQQHLERAVAVLRSGGVIACATEGVWGLSCDPLNESAVDKILQLKGREAAKGMILVAGDSAQFQRFLARLAPARQQEIRQSWPGPVTWVVPHAGELPAWVTGDNPGVALRVTNHPQLAALCNAFGGPLVSTSANPQGRDPARSALAVRRYFGKGIDYVLPGRLGGRRRPSAIHDALSGRILRPG